MLKFLKIINIFLYGNPKLISERAKYESVKFKLWNESSITPDCMYVVTVGNRSDGWTKVASG